MGKYQGSCHCGKVKFEIETDLTWVSECNCSICTKKGAIHHRVKPEQFNLISGEDALTLYQFNTNTAKHYFCNTCGIQPFTRPRLNPEMYTINVNTLDNFDLDTQPVEWRHFDGKNFEDAAKDLK